MRSEDIFALLTEYTLEMILMFDETGRITYANKAAVEKISCDPVREDVVISDILPREFEMIDGKLMMHCTPGPERIQTEVYRKNKTCFSAEVRLIEPQKDPVEHLCFIWDITRRTLWEKRAYQARQEMEDALKVKSQFTANVTHELRTPVNGILGNTRELAGRETDPEKIRILELIERGCNDMHAIINNVLDFSKLEAGKFVLENRRFNLREMIAYVRSNHINKITEKGLEFFLTIAPDVPEYVIGDELRIVQILNNLLSNACKFTPAGRIALEVVKTAQAGNRAELFFMVIDSGIGIDKADQDKLFQSFSQVEASTSRKYGGTGLGLNICKQLVELMNGNIRVESEKNKGTMFSFHIWVELPTEELANEQEKTGAETMMQKLPSLSEIFGEEEMWQYGTPANLEELKKKMSKLILSVEMNNWEKAEMFMETVKELTSDAPKEVKSAALRLKMAVQKGDYAKTTEAYKRLQEEIARGGSRSGDGERHG